MAGASTRLTADCAACAALCCIAPPFDAVQGFGFDKPACTACPNLGAGLRCTIHATLREDGFPGCVAFDCHGAGPRATRAVIDTPRWPIGPEHEARLFALYAQLLPLHEQMALLDTAASRVMSGAARDRIRLRAEALDAHAERLVADPHRRIDAAAERRETLALLRELLGST